MKVIIVALIALTLFPEALSQCDESFSINEDSTITVSAPQFPERYRFGPFCTYTIEAPAGTVFTATCDLEIFYDTENGVCYVTEEFPHFIFFLENGVGFCGTGSVTQTVIGDTMTINFFRPQSRGSTPRSLIRTWRRSGLNGFTCEIDVDVPGEPPVDPGPECSCPTQCGLATVSDKRILNGDDVVQGSYPWIASLNIDDAFLCTASIIGCNTILTAAHCIDGAGFVEVTVGDHNRNDPTEPFQAVYTSTTFFVHPLYDEDAISNDIGLIKLSQDIPFGGTTPQANPICLPTSPVVDGTIATTSGWGLREDGNLPAILQEVEQIVFTSASCTNGLGIFFDPTQLCSVGNDVPNSGICSGDSGGPLFTTDSGPSVILGVNSFGFVDNSPSGCNAEFVSGFSDVFEQIDWIRETAAAQGLTLCS